MEQQAIPNSKLILILGIISIPLCCAWGIGGLITGVVALILAKKAMIIYNEEPDSYTGLNNIKLGKILAIVGIVLSLAFIIFALSVSQEQLLEWQLQLEEMQRQQQENA